MPFCALHACYIVPLFSNYVVLKPAEPVESLFARALIKWLATRRSLPLPLQTLGEKHTEEMTWTCHYANQIIEEKITCKEFLFPQREMCLSGTRFRSLSKKAAPRLTLSDAHCRCFATVVTNLCEKIIFSPDNYNSDWKSKALPAQWWRHLLSFCNANKSVVSELSLSVAHLPIVPHTVTLCAGIKKCALTANRQLCAQIQLTYSLSPPYNGRVLRYSD